MKKPLQLALLAWLLLGWATWARPADSPAADAERVDRLAKLCKVWGTVRYLHPYLAYKDIDWDKALALAVPKVIAAGNDDEYAKAVQGMLDALGDPVTKVYRATQAPKPASAEKPADDKGGRSELFAWVDDGVLAVFLNDPARLQRVSGQPLMLAKLRQEIAKAKAVVFDLRGGYWPIQFDEVSFLGLLAPQRMVLPAERYIVHSGYQTQGSGSPGYRSAFKSKAMTTVEPVGKNQPARVGFIVGGRAWMPLLAWALQQTGQGFLVSQGPLDSASRHTIQAVRLGKDAVVEVRVTELVNGDGTEARLQADATIRADADRGVKGPAFQAALQLARALPQPNTPADSPDTRPLPPARWHADKTYPEMNYPDLEYRLLALFRFWNIIHYFYPCKHLMDEDWDRVLLQFIPRFVAAADAVGYDRAIRELATFVPDGHTSVQSQTGMRQFGTLRGRQIGLRRIEGVPVVARLLDPEAAQKQGIQLGDVIETIDGQPAGNRLQEILRYLPGSTQAWREANAVSRLLLGPVGSSVRLTVRGADGKPRDVELPWMPITPPAPGTFSPSAGHKDVYRLLSDTIGYADLTRLTLPEIDPMLEKFKETQAILFDMRGYPRGIFMALAPRLNVKGARFGAEFRRHIVSGMGPFEDGSMVYRQPINPTDKWVYKGQTVMLIDERAISQSEHTGLFLEAACGITFIGSPTAGANGDVTSFTLPGGVRVSMTGQEVRHADGRQLQRIGLVPHIEVNPTIAGIRAGKDEVLDRAIRYVQEGK